MMDELAEEWGDKTDELAEEWGDMTDELAEEWWTGRTNWRRNVGQDGRTGGGMGT